MDRVKELREEKIKREQIAKLVQEQERIRAELEYIEAEESKYINWRSELEEGMTTAGLGVIYLDGTPNVLSNETSAFDSESANVATVVSGGAVKLGVDEGQPFTDLYPGSNHTQHRQASFTFDSTRYDTLVINITNPGGGQGSWCDPSCTFDNIVRYTVYDTDNINNLTSGILSNGDNTIRLPSNVRVKEMDVYIRQFASDGVYSDGYNPPFTINSISTKRLSPISLFVSLDDPEANAFVRDGTSDKMSPSEKKKKLEEQLKSSEDYLNKMYGEGMPKGATTIADYEPQQSFMDIKVAQGLPYTDEDDAFDDPYYKGPPPDLDDDSDFDPDSFEYAGMPKADPSKNPLPIIPYDNPNWERMPGANPPMPTQRGGRYPLAKKKPKSKTVVAHHEPQGEVIKEKKTFKDITKKIPGYYDGKPSPLGFPVEEPPKMKNGFHPDLVDGKKVANRFNRLDPQSAKAMPKTGNPHIDKKVRAAAKKPK